MKKLLVISFISIVFAFCAIPAMAVDHPSTWAAGEVNTAINLGLVPDELQNAYTQPITRAEFASLVMQLQRVWDKDGMSAVNASALDKLKMANSGVFSDTVNVDVICCAALGIVEGDGKGHFMPDDKLTRQQAAKMLYKTCSMFAYWVINEDIMVTTIWRGYASYEMPHNWTDGANIRSYARSSINWCYRHNVMAGVSGNAFDADGNYTREQAILTVLRLYYVNGRALLNTLQNEPDYYPVYIDYSMQSVSGWIDSSLTEHTKDEIGYLTDRGAKIGFITDNVGAGVGYGHFIDQQGNTLLTDLWGTDGKFRSAQVDYPYAWVLIGDLAVKSADAPVYGVVDIETGETWADKMLEDVTGKDYSMQESGPATIESVDTGWYRLVAADGTALSGTYENALAYIGDKLYIGRVGDNPRTYDVIWCDGVNMGRVVRTEIFCFNDHVFDLGSGMYAVQNTNTQITVFDAFGDTISTITTEDAVVLEGSANGLLYVLGQNGSRHIYYTQTGNALPPLFVSPTNSHY